MTIFVMHIRRQHCTGCGNDEQFSTLYQAEEVPRPGQAKKYLPCYSIGPLDPVKKEFLPPAMTPICAACVDDSRATIGAQTWANWQETLSRKYAPPPAPSGAARTTPKAPPSLEDLA